MSLGTPRIFCYS